MKKIIVLLLVLIFSSKATTMRVVPYDPFKKVDLLLKKHNKNRNLLRYNKPKISVSAIFNDKAFINGKFYKIGDIIHGYRIIKISKKAVWMRKNSIIKRVFLVKSDIFTDLPQRGQQ